MEFIKDISQNFVGAIDNSQCFENFYIDLFILAVHFDTSLIIVYSN